MQKEKEESENAGSAGGRVDDVLVGRIKRDEREQVRRRRERARSEETHIRDRSLCFICGAEIYEGSICGLKGTGRIGVCLT